MMTTFTVTYEEDKETLIYVIDDLTKHSYPFYLIRKPFLCLSLNFLKIRLEISLRFFKYFFLTFIPLFS